MKMKFLLLIMTLATAFTGCTGASGTSNANSAESETVIEQNTEESTDSQSEDVSVSESDAQEAFYKSLYNTKTDTFPQLSEPEKGETIATIHTNKGDIKVRFFPEEAPKAVENFVTHAKEGYYDGLTFHRVINEFMIQGGDPVGDGTGGESIWGEPFEVEPSLALKHFRGALCMAKSSLPVSIGSQFYIVQNDGLDEQSKQALESYKQQGDEVVYTGKDFELKVKDIYPEAVIDEYLKNGGTPSLDIQYTVFGQVYEGLDVVDTIAKVETDDNDKPKEDVIIESVEVGEY